MKVWRNISLWYRFKTCHSDNKEWFVPCSVFDVQFYSQNKNLQILILDWCIIDHPLVEILISMATLNLSLVSKIYHVMLTSSTVTSGPKFDTTPQRNWSTVIYCIFKGQCLLVKVQSFWDDVVDMKKLIRKNKNR